MAISIKKARQQPNRAIVRPSRQPRLRFDLLRLLGKSVSAKEVIFFYSQLALMLEIGTPLTNCLKAVAVQTTNSEFEKIVRSMLRDIEEGRQLSEAMRRNPKLFPNIVISMVKAGETGGFLKDTIERIVEMQEKRQAFIAQLRSALTYPVVLCLLGFGVVIFVVVGILPKFMVLFEGKEALLPWTTRMLMSLSQSMRAYWWGYIFGFLGLIAAGRFWIRSESGKMTVEKTLMNLPVVARLVNKIYTSQLLRTLGNLMTSRVPLIEALHVTRATFTNRHFRRFVDEIREHVQQGGRLAKVFDKNRYIMESTKQMVATGEESGNLATVMLRLAAFYDSEVERELKVLSSLIEPVALILLGAVVGMIVSSVVLPLFKIASAVH